MMRLSFALRSRRNEIKTAVVVLRAKSDPRVDGVRRRIRDVGGEEELTLSAREKLAAQSGNERRRVTAPAREGSRIDGRDPREIGSGVVVTDESDAVAIVPDPVV